MSTHQWQPLPGLAVCLALALGAPAAAAQEESSPAVRQRGNAAVEYRDEAIHVVAAYYYSQRNHDRRWIMIETALSTTAPATIARSAMALRTPDGGEIPLASQQEIGADVNRIRTLLQNAGPVSHDVVSYFTQRDRVESMNLFTLPGEGIVHESIVVDRDRVAVGRLFFASPTGAWESGEYTLVVRHGDEAAELPIRLE